jgi:hypothetical protein
MELANNSEVTVADKRAGGGGGMTRLWPVGRHWPAAPHHERSASRLEI